MEVIKHMDRPKRVTLAEMRFGQPFIFTEDYDIDDLQEPFMKIDVSKMMGKRKKPVSLVKSTSHCIVVGATGVASFHPKETLVITVKAKIHMDY